jgi:methylglutaconyl-CoA hydratase
MPDYPEYKTVLLELKDHIATVILNRPEVHNAFNDELINDLYDVFAHLNNDEDIRVIILTGNGKTFCAGADLNWMKSVVHYSYEDNYKESLKLAELMHLIFTHNKPVIAKINGPAIGGGVGLVSVCDISIASNYCKFGLSEVSLGLVPAVISPYVIERIGQAKARELFITGERISAERAVELNLINYTVPIDDIDRIVDEFASIILNNGPNAVRIAKEMIFKISQMKFPEITTYNAELISNLRLSEEGQEGMNAFLEKRRPRWRTIE